MGLLDFFKKETPEERIARKAAKLKSKAVNQVFKSEDNLIVSISATMLFCKFNLSIDDARQFFITTIVAHLCGDDFDVVDREVLSKCPLEPWQRKWLYDFVIARFVTKDENKVNLLSLELGKREHAKDREFSIVEIEGDLEQCDIPLFKEKHSKVCAALQKSLIKNNMKVEWLQSAVRHPAFQDIAFQYNGNVFSILIGFVHKDNWKTKVCVYQDKFRRQLRECKEHGLIPCILPFDFDKEEFIFEPLEVISSKTDKIIDFLSYECNSESIWSEWEYYNFGVNFAEYYLESKGYKIINCSNLLGIDPCINAEFQGQQIYLIVNTFNRQTPITYGVCRNMFSAYQNRKGYYLELRVSERNLNKEIRHGAPLDLEVKGMIPIEDAIDRSTSTNRSPEYIYLRWNEKNQ
jgi:hypothetical protein